MKSIEEKYKNVIEKLITEVIDKEKDLVDISTLAGVSLSITEVRFESSKQQFWNLIRLRHGWENAI